MMVLFFWWDIFRQITKSQALAFFVLFLAEQLYSLNADICSEKKTKVMETTSFGFAASLLFVGVPTIFLIGLFVSTKDGEKSSFYSDSGKGRLSPEPQKK